MVASVFLTKNGLRMAQLHTPSKVIVYIWNYSDMKSMCGPEVLTVCDIYTICYSFEFLMIIVSREI